jgi:RNA polymerase sigma-70 factor (ECF subfamily)
VTALEREFSDGFNGASGDERDAPAYLIARLYEQHHSMVRALCQLLLRDPLEADDAAQQTFLSAFGSLIDGTVPNQAAAWLATIARRECWARTAQRSRRPVALDEHNSPASAAGNPLEDAIRNFDLTALWAEINALPRQQRKAFLMREFSGLSYAEVAEALGATESAVEALLVRARRQLRDGLEPALRVGNLVATPILLLQHRLSRLSHGRSAEAGVAAAGIPVAAKVAATVAAAVLAGSAGVAVGADTPFFKHRGTAQAASLLAPRSLDGSTPLERLIGVRPERSVFAGWSPTNESAPSGARAPRALGNTALGKTAPDETASAPGDPVVAEPPGGPSPVTDSVASTPADPGSPAAPAEPTVAPDAPAASPVDAGAGEPTPDAPTSTDASSPDAAPSDLPATDPAPSSSPTDATVSIDPAADTATEPTTTPADLTEEPN